MASLSFRALLLFFSALLLLAPARAATELWTDGGFESCSEEFFTIHNQSAGVMIGDVAIQAFDAGFVAFGLCALNIFNMEGNTDPALTFGIGQTISTGLTAGHVLQLSFLLINPDGGAPESFGVNYAFDSSASSTNVFQITDTAPFAYTQFVAAPIVVPAGAASLSVNFTTFIEGPTGFYLDNVSLIDLGLGATYTAPAPVVFELPASIGGGAVTEPELPLIGGLLANGGFESGAMDGWLLVDNFNEVELTGIMFSDPPWVPCFGAYCVQFMSSPNVTTIYQSVAALPSTVYTLSFKLFHSAVITGGINGDAAATVAFVVTAQFSSASTITTLFSQSGRHVSAAGFNFKTFTYQLTAPSGTTPLDLTVSFSGVDDTGAFWLLDDVILVASTSVRGDPQFIGFLGQNYQVHGVSGDVYNLVSDRELQVNARFVFLNSGNCPPQTVAASLPRLTGDCWSHPGSYLGAVSFQQLVDGRVARLALHSGSATLGYSSVTVNGSQQLAVGSSYQVRDSTGRVVLSVHRPHSHSVTVSTPLLSFQLDNSDEFINQAVSILAPVPELRERRMHGLLGQTHTPRAASRVLPIEGEVDDYVVGDDLFGNNFLHNRFVQDATH